MPTDHDRKAHRAWRQARADDGLCVHCGKKNTNPNSRWYCKKCAYKGATLTKKIYAARMAQGLCISCHEPLAPHSVRYCVRHLAIHLEHVKDYRARQRRKLEVKRSLEGKNYF